MLTMPADLYNSDILALAADIPLLGVPTTAQGRAARRSQVCGSQVEVGVVLDDAGRIADLGMEVEACALGQASASILARHAVGATEAEITAARDALEGMLRREGPAPTGRFAELAVLEGVRAYPRRHASTLLAFRAAAAAVEAARANAAGRVTPAG